MHEFKISIDELSFLSRAVAGDTARPAIHLAWLQFYECGQVSIIATDTHRMHVVNVQPGELAYPKAVELSVPLDVALILKYAKIHKAADVLVIVGKGVSFVDVVYRSKHGDKREPAPTIENPGTPPNFIRVVPNYEVMTDMRCEFFMNPTYIAEARVTKGRVLGFRGVSASRPFILSEHPWTGTPWAVRTFAVVMPYGVDFGKR